MFACVFVCVLACVWGFICLLKEGYNWFCVFCMLRGISMLKSWLQRKDLPWRWYQRLSNRGNYGRIVGREAKTPHEVKGTAACQCLENNRKLVFEVWPPDLGRLTQSTAGAAAVTQLIQNLWCPIAAICIKTRSHSVSYYSVKSEHTDITYLFLDSAWLILSNLVIISDVHHK